MSGEGGGNSPRLHLVHHHGKATSGAGGAAVDNATVSLPRVILKVQQAAQGVNLACDSDETWRRPVALQSGPPLPPPPLPLPPPLTAKRMVVGHNVTATLFPEVGVVPRTTTAAAASMAPSVAGSRFGAAGGALRRRSADGGRRLEPIRVKKPRGRRQRELREDEEEVQEGQDGKQPAAAGAHSGKTLLAAGPPSSLTPTGPPLGPHVGLGPALWLHRFIYRSSGNRSAEKQVADDARGRHAATNSQPESGLRAAGARGGLHNWNTLRERLIRAKITDAFENLKFQVQDKTYTSLRTLGEGGYSKVYEVFNKERELFALKVVDLSATSDFTTLELLKEIEMLRRFESSEFVINMLSHDRRREGGEGGEGGVDELYILLERGECDLSHLLERLTQRERMTPAKLRFYWEQMLESVRAIHAQRVVHTDIKPNNFVLVRGHLKLIDFGLAVELAEGQAFVQRSFLGGTRDYMSPESLQCYIIEDGAIDLLAMKERQVRVKVGYSSDVWALGVILYQLSYGGVAPFSRVPGGRLGKVKAVLSPDLPVDLEPLDDHSLLHVLRRCLDKDPQRRADVHELLAHKFLRPVNSVHDGTFCSHEHDQQHPQRR